ncbi:MAG: hypothetical protein KDK08_29630 [Rhizobiaceae bacterium]|nr:hypothetical protein [Rhizobiaceae bacterium]
MKARYILGTAIVAILPVVYGLGHVEGKGVCNAPNTPEAFGETAQGVLMNTPLIGSIYKSGLRSGIQGTCTESRLVALVFTGQSELIGLETPDSLK